MPEEKKVPAFVIVGLDGSKRTHRLGLFFSAEEALRHAALYRDGWSDVRVESEVVELASLHPAHRTVSKTLS